MPNSNWADDVQKFLGQDYELDKLWQEHQEAANSLEDLEKIKWLNSEQEFERKRLQKLKLASKDRMVAIVRDLQESVAAAGQ